MKKKTSNFGMIALMGSGETTPSGGRIFEFVASKLKKPVDISILETPAGFELNAERVAGKVKDYIKTRLQNYSPRLHQIPARKLGGIDSPDNPAILEPIMHSNLIFLGPGSPTYTVRQLLRTRALEMIKIRHHEGAALVLASAASIAIGSYCLPVYEIYKVGEDLHWKPGIDYFKPFGLSLVIVPHWNNQEGGKELDTSRCFMGVERFSLLMEQLPKEVSILGIDEQTGVIIDPNSGNCSVLGSGAAHLLKAGQEKIIKTKESFNLSELGPFLVPEKFRELLDQELVDEMEASHHNQEKNHIPTEKVKLLLKDREQARRMGDWKESDRLRKMIQEEGWIIKDTKRGQELEPGKIP